MWLRCRGFFELLCGQGTGPAGFPAVVALDGWISRHHPTNLCRVQQYRCSLHGSGHQMSPPELAAPAQCCCEAPVGWPCSHGSCSRGRGGRGPHEWVFSSTSRMRWSLCPAATSPQTFSSGGRGRLLVPDNANAQGISIFHQNFLLGRR